MNAKHPVDQLFSRGLRDAEAAPPPGVWEGIAQRRHKAQQERRRKRMGLFAVLPLLLAIVGAYWAYRSRVPVADAPAHSASRMTDTLVESKVQKRTSVPTTNRESPAVASTVLEQHPATQSTSQERPSNRSPLRSSDGPRDRYASTTRNSTAAGAAPEDGPAAAANDRTDAPSKVQPSPSISAPAVATHSEATGGTPDAKTIAESGPTWVLDNTFGGRAEHLTSLSIFLPRDSMTLITHDRIAPLAYFLSKGSTWVGVQASWSDPAMRWNGGSEEIATLNKSESWSAQTSLGVVLVRTWQSGWFGEVGAQYARINSNLFYTERTPASTQTVTDTTWTATQADQLTVYTWNIITNSTENPGSEVRFDVQNHYDVLRIAPALGFRKQWRRLGLSLRAGPLLTLFLSRSGNTLGIDQDPEPGSSRLVMQRLDEASLDSRFRPQWGFSFGADLGYSITEHWSLAAGPSRSVQLTEQSGSPGGDGWGANLRLLYEFRQHERRAR